jgi:hypothetical protein
MCKTPKKRENSSSVSLLVSAQHKKEKNEEKINPPFHMSGFGWKISANKRPICVVGERV